MLSKLFSKTQLQELQTQVSQLSMTSNLQQSMTSEPQSNLTSALLDEKNHVIEEKDTELEKLKVRTQNIFLVEERSL